MSDDSKKFIEALQKRSDKKLKIEPDSYFTPNYDPYMQLGEFVNL